VTFRPYPGLTIACALLFALLCGLGAWQLERLQWKLALIARVNGHMASAPLPLDRIQAMNGDDVQYRRVTLKGHKLTIVDGESRVTEDLGDDSAVLAAYKKHFDIGLDKLPNEPNVETLGIQI